MAPCTRRPGAGWLGVPLPLHGLLLLTLLQHAATASQLDANQVSAGGKQSGSWGTCSGPATRAHRRAPPLLMPATRSWRPVPTLPTSLLPWLRLAKSGEQQG